MSDTAPHCESTLIIDNRPRTRLAKRISRWYLKNGVAVTISLMAAAFTGWQGCEAHQARLDAKEAAEKARAEAEDASNKQREDVKASRKAAEDSAQAAQELATGMNRSAKAAEASAEAGRESVLISKRSLQLSERPTLESIDGKLSAPVTAGVAPEITVDTYNTGKGPAYSVRIQQVASIGSTFMFQFFDKITVYADVMGVGSTAGRPKLMTISNLPPLHRIAVPGYC